MSNTSVLNTQENVKEENYQIRRILLRILPYTPLIILAIIIAMGVLSHSSLRELENTNNWFINLAFIVLSVVIEGTLVMLYLNRVGKHAPINQPK